MIRKEELSFAIISTNVLTMVNISIRQPKLSSRHSIMFHECNISCPHLLGLKDFVNAYRVLPHETMDNVIYETICEYLFRE